MKKLIIRSLFLCLGVVFVAIDAYHGNISGVLGWTCVTLYYFTDVLSAYGRALYSIPKTAGSPVPSDEMGDKPTIVSHRLDRILRALQVMGKENNEIIQHFGTAI